MEGKNYVIKNPRLRQYLFYLGFDFKEVPDQTGRQKVIYLFKNCSELHNAITYYTSTKNTRIKAQNRP